MALLTWSVFEDAPVFGGLDLSSRQDLTALVLVAKDATGAVHLQSHFLGTGAGPERAYAARARCPTTSGAIRAS